MHLPGFVPNPYPFMRRAAIYALPSRWEGFGLVVIEAMACGAPVVAANCPSGPTEILEGGQYGVLVPPEDSAAFARALRDVLDDDTLRARLREVGARRVLDFTPQRLVPPWEAVLRDAAARRFPDARGDRDALAGRP